MGEQLYSVRMCNYRVDKAGTNSVNYSRCLKENAVSACSGYMWPPHSLIPMCWARSATATAAMGQRLLARLPR